MLYYLDKLRKRVYGFREKFEKPLLLSIILQELKRAR